MPRRTKEEAAQTRRRIIEAALDVVAEKGYSQTRLVDVADKIGLSKGAIYWHFKSKSDLLTAMISHGEKRYHGVLMEKMPWSVVKLREKIIDYARGVAENEDFRKFEFFYHFQVEWSAELIADVQSKLAALRGDRLKNLNEILICLQENGELNREFNVRELSLSLFILVTGAVQLFLMGEYSTEQFCDLIERNFNIIIEPYKS